LNNTACRREQQRRANIRNGASEHYGDERRRCHEKRFDRLQCGDVGEKRSKWRWRQPAFCIRCLQLCFRLVTTVTGLRFILVFVFAFFYCCHLHAVHNICILFFKTKLDLFLQEFYMRFLKDIVTRDKSQIWLKVMSIHCSFF
jgi:hypothetical protein